MSNCTWKWPSQIEESVNGIISLCVTVVAGSHTWMTTHTPTRSWKLWVGSPPGFKWCVKCAAVSLRTRSSSKSGTRRASGAFLSVAVMLILPQKENPFFRMPGLWWVFGVSNHVDFISSSNGARIYLLIQGIITNYGTFAKIWTNIELHPPASTKNMRQVG